MNTRSICPCCSNPLIHYIGNHREYWFCPHCWSEMPNLVAFKMDKSWESTKLINLSTKLPKSPKLVLVS